MTDCRHWRSHRVTSALIGRNSKIPLLRDIVDFTPATDIDSVTLLFRSQSLAQVWRKGKTEQSSMRFTVKSSKNEDPVCNFGCCGRHKGFWLTSQQTIVYREQTKTQLKNHAPNQNWNTKMKVNAPVFTCLIKTVERETFSFGKRIFNIKLVIFQSVTQVARKKKSVCSTKYQFSIKNENAKWKSSSTRSFRSCSRGSETNPNLHLVNKPSWISPHEVIWSWFILILSLSFISEE